MDGPHDEIPAKPPQIFTKRLKGYDLALKHSRPRFWLYTAGSYLVGFAAGAKSVETFLSPLFPVGLLVYLLPANIYLYGLNDLADIDTDLLNPKKTDREAVAWGAVRRRLSIYVAGSALAVLLFSWNLTAFLLNSLYILMATFYSLPPIRFKARPFLDSFSNWFYIIPGAAGYHLSSNNLLPPLWFWVVGALWTAGMHALSAVPDIEPDRRAGIKTIATTLGPRGTMFFVSACWTIVAAALALRDPLTLPAFTYPVIALFLTARLEILPSFYWRFPLINTVMGMLAFFYAGLHLIPITL
jgi:4-hydroxybenzoate polyprenyltransferase